MGAAYNISRETRVSDKIPVMFVLATYTGHPGHHTDLLKNLLIFYLSYYWRQIKSLIVGDV